MGDIKLFVVLCYLAVRVFLSPTCSLASPVAVDELSFPKAGGPAGTSKEYVNAHGQTALFRDPPGRGIGNPYFPMEDHDADRC